MAELMVPTTFAEIILRPEAPDDLTDEQSEEWHAIVNTMPADHFMRGNFPLLSQLCRHIVASRRIAQLIEQAANEKVLDLKELCTPAPASGRRERDNYPSIPIDATNAAIHYEGRDDPASDGTIDAPLGPCRVRRSVRP